MNSPAATPGAKSSLAAAAVTGENLTGTGAWRLLWDVSRTLSVLVIGWVVAGALLPAVVVVSLGLLVGAVPGAVEHGMGSADGSHLITTLVAAAVVYAVSLVLDPIGNALGTAAKTRVTSGLQERLLTAVSHPVGVGHLENGDVMDRLARAEGSLSGFFPGDAPVTWAGILGSRISGVVACIVVAFYSWYIGVGLLLMWIVVRKLMLDLVVRQATELRGLTSQMRRAWYFMGVGSKARDAKEVRVYGLAAFVAGRFREAYAGAITAATAGLRAIHIRAAGCFTVVLATYCVVLVVIAEQARHGSLSLRGLAIVLPMVAVTMSAGNVTFADITLAWTLAGLPDVDRLESDLTGSANELPGTAPVAGVPRLSVRFEGVRFRYPSGSTDVLAGVDLDLIAGTSTAIVGVNGAGKSTLIGLLSRLWDPSAGRILVDGSDVRRYHAGQWQRAVAVMSQDPVHYPVSAYQNVAFGSPESQDDRVGVEKAAAAAGFLEVVKTLPEGWDTLLSRQLPGGVDLSGGQWQRLALARALFATTHGATVLVLDEPTAALDVRAEARFYDRFLEITRGLTTVVISHRFATVRKADVICVLDGGRITERGTHHELVAAGGTYARMYELQAGRFRESS